MRLFLYLVIICACFAAFNADSEETEDFYKLLGVPKDASVKDIRKAFKVLAVKMHPDKNQDDKKADAKFIKLAQAYEILKDPETRKRYDLHGDTGIKGGRPQYHSYTYYRDEFGLYDDDPFIVTLSKADYEVNVLDKNQAWFINFYSPQCHHCHTLAPVWRKLAAELEGVVRLAAVNCEEDWVLCQQLSIESYPTLLYYEKEAHLYEGDHYRGSKSQESLEEFILSNLRVEIKQITPENWEEDQFNKQQWLLFLCPEDDGSCPETNTRLKLAAAMEGLMSVGMITDRNLVDKIQEKKSFIVFWQINEKNPDNTVVNNVAGSDSKEIVENILNLLPNPELLNEDKFKEIRAELKSGGANPWLICFYLGTATELNLQLKRLPTLVPNINIGLVHCGKSAGLCSLHHVSHYPSWGVLKTGGAFEQHHGRDILHDVAAFARDSSKSTNLHALSPSDFYNIKSEGSVWFIDWYAPWCPPCRKLMPEVRRASQHFSSNSIQFGTIDCTLHSHLCSSEGIQSYPTVMLYNGSKISYFHGVPNEQGLVTFVDDILNPSVIALDQSSFVQLMRKPEKEMWIVDFFAPWCGPCQRLAPEWSLLAKEMKNFSQIKIAHVDCVQNVDLCSAQNINSYPTIRMYPLGSKGLNTIAMYNGHRDVTSLKSWIFSFLPSPIEQLNGKEFRKQILSKKFLLPWLIDFYAPWCGHCVNFEPDFKIVAQRLDGKVRSGRVDCERERDLCRELRITSYPTVMFYISPKKFFEINSQTPKEIIQKVKKYLDLRPTFSHDEL